MEPIDLTTEETMEAIDLTHERLETADLATQPGEVAAPQQFPARLIGEKVDEDKLPPQLKSFCLSCRKSVDVTDAKHSTTASGRKMLKGKCSHCSKNTTRFV